MILLFSLVPPGNATCCVDGGHACRKNELDKLALDFFKTFAQYESSLKENSFFRIERSGGVKVDWDRFANEIIRNSFLEQPREIQEHLKYILNEPPKKQGVDENNQIVWQDVSDADQSVQALFGHICRMRNNLFHGSKFNGTGNIRESRLPKMWWLLYTKVRTIKVGRKPNGVSLTFRKNLKELYFFEILVMVLN